MHEMRIMGQSGDTKLLWSSDAEAEVDNARRTFNDLRARGYSAFAVKAGGGKGSQVREFDPEAESLIMIPQLVGG